MNWYGGFAPYVSVAERKKQAARKVSALKKKGITTRPILIEGRTIAKTFWGKAWCTHLESYSDYENRLPRGRTYVRNGSVIDLQVDRGTIKALVNGSSIYQITIAISAIAANKWKNIAKECAGKIDSLIELLQGKFSKGVMEIITHHQNGLFPHPKEIKLNCSCPDWADMCKHVAAVLYGIGARLDEYPEELFLLRQVDHAELIANASQSSLVKTAKNKAPALSDNELSTLFGIDIEASPQAADKNNSAVKKTSTAKKKLSGDKPAKAATKTKAKPAVKPTRKTKLAQNKKALSAELKVKARADTTNKSKPDAAVSRKSAKLEKPGKINKKPLITKTKASGSKKR